MDREDGRLDQAVGKARHIAEDVRDAAGSLIERARDEIAEHVPEAPSDPLGSIAALARRATAVATNRAPARSDDAGAPSDDTDAPIARRPASAKKRSRTPSAKANVWTIPHERGWTNKREGAQRVAKIFPTKAAAQAAGRTTAQREKVEHVVLNRDGKIGERNSYGDDSSRRKG